MRFRVEERQLIDGGEGVHLEQLDIAGDVYQRFGDAARAAALQISGDPPGFPAAAALEDLDVGLQKISTVTLP